MRYWFASLLIIAFAVASSESQDKKKEKDKEPGKKKETKDPETVPEVNEVLGKSFKEWTTEIHAADPGKRETAMKMILNFGPQRAYDAVPAILEELEKHTLKKTANVDLAVRVNGTMALSTIFKYKKDPDPKHVARAVAIYRAFLNEDQLILKIRTVQGLVYLGPKSRDALPEVTKMAGTFGSLTWEARKEAMQVLGMLGFTDKGTANDKVMIEIGKGLTDTSYQVRMAALHAISRLASAATDEQRKSAQNKIELLLKNDSDLQVIITAHLCAMTLDKKVSKRHLKPVTDLVLHKDPNVRLLAVQAHAVTGKDGQVAVPTLLGAIHDPEVSVGVAAINSLISMDAEDAVIPVLRKLVNDKTANDVLRQAAYEGLEFIAQRDKMRKEMKKDDPKDKKDKKDKK